MTTSIATTPTGSPIQPHLNDYPAEFESLICAVKEKKAHIIPFNAGYRIHLGDKATMKLNCADFSMNDIAVSGTSGTFNYSNAILETNGLKIPMSKQSICRVVAYLAI